MTENPNEKSLPEMAGISSFRDGEVVGLGHTFFKCIYGCQPKNSGIPKWMVYNGSNPIKMDDLGGPTPIFGNTHDG